MGLSAFSSPVVAAGKGSGNITTLPVSEQAAPSIFFAGVGLQDPRRPYVGGEAGPETGALMAVGFAPSGFYTVCDQAPATKAVNNIAAAAAVTTGTNIALVSSTGAGVTVTTSATFIPQTGNTVASGALALDGVPGVLTYGTGKSIGVADPTKNLSRVTSITASSGAVGGAFLVQGADLYGFPQTEKITAASSPSGATTTTGKKAFKFITKVTAQVTDTFSYSVGTGDVFGFPLLCNEFPFAMVGWAGALIAASTGFVAAVSSTATNTTGDARGTYAVQSGSNGTIVLQMFQSIQAANLAGSGAAGMAGYFGVTPA